jgi:hypothetical protein
MSSSFHHAGGMKTKHIIGTSQKWNLQILFFPTGSQGAFAIMIAAFNVFHSIIKEKLYIFLDIHPRLLYLHLKPNADVFVKRRNLNNVVVPAAE